MLAIFFVILAIAGALIATYTDLKSRIIPNKLTFGLIAIGIVGNISYALYTSDLSLLQDLVKGVILTFIIGYTFWVLGGWSAGDAKEFLFLASLLPRYPKFLHSYLNPSLASYPFPLTILVNTFVIILPVLIVYSIVISYKNLNLIELLKPLFDLKKYVKEALIVVSALLFGLMLGKPYLGLIAIIAFHVPMLKDVHRYLISFILIISFIAGDDSLIRLINLTKYFMATAIFFIAIGLIWNSLQLLMKKGLQEVYRVSDLHEGDVIAEEIYIQNGEIKRDSRSIIEKFKALMLSEGERNTRKSRTLIASPKAAGLTFNELSSLKDLVAKGQLDDEIILKKSMPMAPIYLLGLTLALLLGDIVVLLR